MTFLRTDAAKYFRGGALAALLCCLGVGCPAPPQPDAPPGSSYELSIVRARRLGAATMRFDSATGRVWLQPASRRSAPFKPLGDHSQAIRDGQPGRFELTTVPRRDLLELLRFDTSLGLAALHDLTGEKPGWRDVDQTTGDARGPGAVEPGDPGRYQLLLSRTNVGARILRVDTESGKAWTMPLNGIGGWLLMSESQDAYAVEDLRFPDGSPPLAGSPTPQIVRPAGRPSPVPPAPPSPEAADPASPADTTPAPDGAALIESLRGDLPDEVRAWAAGQLGSQGHRHALPELREALEDPTQVVAAAAADAIAALGEGETPDP